ncbi:MAG: hypothetical protein WAW37_00635, partial [Syntrophobacteraceae bacterium]
FFPGRSPLEQVAAFSEIGGRIQPESVAAFHRIRWSESSEYAVKGAGFLKAFKKAFAKGSRNQEQEQEHISPIVPQRGNGRAENSSAKRKSSRKESNTYESDAFRRFFTVYPKKQNKPAALKAWNKLSPDEALAEMIIQAVIARAASHEWRKEKGQYLPLPSSFLNGRLPPRRPIQGLRGVQHYWSAGLDFSAVPLMTKPDGTSRLNPARALDSLLRSLMPARVSSILLM